MAGPDISQANLSPSSIEERSKVAAWFETAVFTSIEVIYNKRKIEGILRCEDPERDAKLEPLLAAMVT